MIFFVAMPFVIGLMNFVVPLQLGVRDVAFPDAQLGQLLADRDRRAAGQHLAGRRRVRADRLAAVSAAVGAAPTRPASASTTTCGRCRSPASARLLTGINFVTTILKMRAPGMSYMRMPMFCWTALASNLLIVAAFPILTATLAMLLLDRYLGFHFFTNEAGGNAMMFVNLIWAWGHPEVYILILPAFGIFSEVIVDLLRQAAVRLPLDGRRDHGDLHPLLHGLAAPLLHHGRRRRRQRASSAS